MHAAPTAGFGIILQHLLAGMNAHINLDLGIAAVEAAPGDAIHDLAADFRAINNLLFELTQKVEDGVLVVSPWIGLLDTIGGRTGDAVIEFSIAKARALAWNTALDLAPWTRRRARPISCGSITSWRRWGVWCCIRRR